MSYCAYSRMRLIQGIEITDAILQASNIPENDYPVYSPAATYQDGSRVLVPELHRIYLSTTTQTNKYPPSNLTSWVDEGASNRWRMFDAYASTQTVGNGAINITVAAGMLFDSLALFNLSGFDVRITSTSASEGVIYDKTIPLVDTADITDWDRYFFSEVSAKDTLLLNDLPRYFDASLAISINGSGGQAKCGHFVIGNQFDVGEVRWGFSLGLTDFSRVNTDPETGIVSIRKGRYAKRHGFPVRIEHARVDAVYKKLIECRSTPVVYVGGEIFEANTLFGLYPEMEIITNDEMYSTCDLRIQGIV